MRAEHWVTNSAHVPAQSQAVARPFIEPSADVKALEGKLRNMEKQLEALSQQRSMAPVYVPVAAMPGAGERCPLGDAAGSVSRTRGCRRCAHGPARRRHPYGTASRRHPHGSPRRRCAHGARRR